MDIPSGRLFRYDPTTNHHEQIWQGEPIGGFTIQADGTLLLFGHNGSVRIWKQGQIETLVEEIPAERGGRFNDVIADPARISLAHCFIMRATMVKGKAISLFGLLSPIKRSRVTEELGVAGERIRIVI